MNGGLVGLDVERCDAGDGTLGEAFGGQDALDILEKVLEAAAAFAPDTQSEPSRMIDEGLFTPRHLVIGNEQAQLGIVGKRQRGKPGSFAFGADFLARQKRSEKPLEVGGIGQGVALGLIEIDAETQLARGGDGCAAAGDPGDAARQSLAP